MKKIVYYCSECDDSFCQNCFDNEHKSLKKSKHEKKPLENQNQKCKKHNIKLNYYCFDCDSLLCSTCVVEEHKNHNTPNFETSNQKFKQTILDKIQHKEKSYQKELDLNEKKLEDKINSIKLDLFECHSYISKLDNFQEIYNFSKTNQKFNIIEKKVFYCSYKGCKKEAIYCCANKPRSKLVYQSICHYLSCQDHSYHLSDDCCSNNVQCSGANHDCSTNSSYCGKIKEFGIEKR